MTSAVDLRPDHLRIVQDILREHLPPSVEVWVFGSRADWSTKDSSDLDLALEGETRLSTELLGALEHSFEESDLPYTVDVVDLNRVGASFRRIVESRRAPLPLGETDQQARADGHSTGVSSNWRKVALCKLIHLQLSSVDKKSKADEQSVQLCNYTDVYRNSFIHADMDFMTATATEREIANCTLLLDDVIITKDSERYDDIGVPALVRENIPNLICGYHLAILRPRPSRVDGTYLFYALSHHETQQQFHSLANGVTRFGLRKADIGLVTVPLPSLPEQRAIAHVLGTLDDKIELNRRMNETLEEMARALFKSWFVDFDPVRAKMEGRWRRSQSLPGLPAHLYDLFPDRLVDSELGEIPQGWKVQSLDDIATFTNGLALQRFPPEDADWLPVIKIAEMRRGYTEKTGKSSPRIDSRYIVEDGDLLFSWSGSLEVVLWTNGRGALNQHLFKVTSEGFPRWFYLGWLHEHLDEFRRIAAGKATTMGHIRRQHLSDAKVVVPPSEVLDEAGDLFAVLVQQQVHHAVQSRSLIAQRETLLPSLVSGEKSVGAVKVCEDIS